MSRTVVKQGFESPLTAPFLTTGNHGDREEIHVHLPVTERSRSTFVIAVDHPIHVEAITEQVTKHHPHRLKGQCVLRRYHSLIEDALQRIQVAIGDAGQTAAQAVGELLHTHALLGHELPVYGRQGSMRTSKLGLWATDQLVQTDRAGNRTEPVDVAIYWLKTAFYSVVNRL